MSVEVHSLGCRLNLCESEQLRELLSGQEELVVVNSCAVTSEAVRQTRQTIRRARKARPDARLLVTGCAAEIERDMLAAMPEVDGLVANASKLDPALYGRSRVGQDFGRQQGNPSGLQPERPKPPRSRVPARRRHSRGFVQVQNGCDHSCTFCVIPQGRGASLSRPIAAVLADIAGHLEAGAGEIVLTGVDLTSWGHDLPRPARLGTLIAAILAEFPQLARLRLSSIDGAEVDGQLFELIAGEQRVMPHLHLSLQSGDDLILKRMKRRHSRAQAARLVESLRARRPDLAIGADLIAGFPTEDETMHGNNLSLIEELGIVHGHIFPFSARPGTPAARMPLVPPAAVRARAAELRGAVARERARWLAGLIGRRLEVLAESDGTGHSEAFAPVRLPHGTQAAAIVGVVPELVDEGMLA